MKAYFLRRKGNGKETCDGIVSNLDGVEIIREDKISRIQSPNIIIRWGSKVEFSSDFEINTPQMIHSMNHKTKSRLRLFDSGIPVPKTYYIKSEALKCTNFPLIGRKTYHSQGKGIVISNNTQELEKDELSEYWSEFINKDKEFRIYVFFGKVLGVSKKIPNDPSEISWNNSLGNADFETVKWNHFPLTACKLAVKSCEILGVDFSAVDILKKENSNYVIELNSAPTLSPYRQVLFSKGFSWVINEIIKNNKKPGHFGIVENVHNYRDLIFPSLLGE